MLRRSYGSSLTVGAVLVLSSGIVRAEDAATAEALFDQGVSNMEAGNYPVACPALEDSYRLDPKAGALFALADCTERWGKTATAVAHYQDYLGLVSQLSGEPRARHAEREAMAHAAIERLQGGVPELTLLLPQAAPPGTVVLRDGVELGGAELRRVFGQHDNGVGLPIDPGEHLLTTRVPGGPEHVMQVTLVAGDRKTVVLEIELPPPPPPVVPVPSNFALPAKRPDPADVAPVTPSHTAEWLLGGIGVAAIGVGSVTGILVLHKKSIVNSECSGLDCSPDGKAAADAGKNLAVVTDVLMGVGIAGLATSAILLLTQSGSSEATASTGFQPTLSADASGAAVGVNGRW